MPQNRISKLNSGSSRRGVRTAVGTYRKVSGIRDALVARSIRNTCYEYLTGNSRAIGFVEQISWYYSTYRKLARSCEYRLFLFFASDGKAVGYGALKFNSDRLLVTECVTKGYRGQGYGTFILRSMIGMARQEGYQLTAEIWADNAASIALHQKEGFVEASNEIKIGRELRTYVLPDDG